MRDLEEDITEGRGVGDGQTTVRASTRRVTAAGEVVVTALVIVWKSQTTTKGAVAQVVEHAGRDR